MIFINVHCRTFVGNYLVNMPSNGFFVLLSYIYIFNGKNYVCVHTCAYVYGCEYSTGHMEVTGQLLRDGYLLCVVRLAGFVTNAFTS